MVERISPHNGNVPYINSFTIQSFSSLLHRVLYLRMRKPEREAEQDPKKRLVGSSSHRMSRGPDFSVSPVEIFPVEEVRPVGKEDPDLLIINELPRKNMQTNDVVHVDETKLDDDNVNNEYHETATLPMGNKGGKDIPEQDNVYVNNMAVSKGRKLSNPSILPDDVMALKMPTLPPGSTATGTLVEEPRESKIYDIPFDYSNTPDPAHAGDEPPSEYTYVDPPPVLKHARTADSSQNEDGNDSVVGQDYTCISEFPVLTGESEDEHASVHGSDDDYHEYTDPKEMTGVVSYKPTTNHYNNNQMLNTEGRRAHTHRVREDM